MKVCPKCNSSYSDETLNFCLTDGVPLVAEEILDEYLSKHNSKSWHTADTLVDQRFSLSDARPTAVSTSAPTFELGNTTARHMMPPAKSNTALYAILGVLLAALLGGGSYWWFSKSPNQTVKSVLSEETASIPKHAIVPISPEQEAQIKKELTDFMLNWAKTNSNKDSDAHLAHYANLLEVYYGESGKDKNHVLADRLRAYQRYDSILMQVDNLKITPESAESAMIVFDKSWTMRNEKKTSTGSVQQEVHVTKSNGKWLIDAEKDLKVYFLNNRENQTSDGPNQAANNPNPAN
ncbi:MAG TPA: hypothetical protein VIL74_24870 [Pyrinomonadaceae bacterium]|jgi:hypothetical protein